MGGGFPLERAAVNSRRTAVLVVLALLLAGAGLLVTGVGVRSGDTNAAGPSLPVGRPAGGAPRGELAGGRVTGPTTGSGPSTAAAPPRAGTRRVLPVAPLPPDAPPPLRVRFVAKGTKTGVSHVAWSLPVPKDAESEADEIQGHADVDGLATLPPLAVLRWAKVPLEVFGLEVEIPRPPLSADGETLDVEVPIEGRVARITGTLRDADGRPVPSGAVVVRTDDAFPGLVVGGSSDFGGYGVAVGARGEFALDVPGLATPGPDDLAQRLVLLAVASGFEVTRLELPVADARDVSIVLRPDARHGALDLLVRGADGRPAAGARVWMRAIGARIDGRLALPGERGADDEFQEAALARFLGGSRATEQGYDVAQDVNPVLDLSTDAEGRLRLECLPAGTYRVQAVNGMTRDAEPVAADGRLDDGGGGGWQDGHRVAAAEVAETTLTVAPWPGRTTATIRLDAARSVVGRIVADRPKEWCDPGEHFNHLVDLAEWPWVHAEVESGSWGWNDEIRRFDGRFRLTGLPRGATRLGIMTSGRPYVSVEVPAGIGSAALDLGDLHVPGGRRLRGEVTWEDGTEIADRPLGRITLLDGEREDTYQYVNGGSYESLLLRRPPRPGDVLLVDFGPRVAPPMRVPLAPVEDESGFLRQDLRIPRPAVPVADPTSADPR